MANLWRDLGCGERRPVSANPQPSGYERATFTGIINKYWWFRAGSAMNVRVWLRRFIGYLLVAREAAFVGGFFLAARYGGWHKAIVYRVGLNGNYIFAATGRGRTYCSKLVGCI